MVRLCRSLRSPDIRSVVSAGPERVLRRLGRFWQDLEDIVPLMDPVQQQRQHALFALLLLTHGDGDRRLGDGVHALGFLGDGYHKFMDPGKQQQQRALCALLLLTCDDGDGEFVGLEDGFCAILGLEDGVRAVVGLEDGVPALGELED